MTETAEDTVKRAAEHFEDLFSKKRGLPRKQRKKMKKLKHTLGERFTTKEIQKHIKLLKNNKAVGPDGIPNEFLKAGGPKLVKALEQLFNEIHEKETVPESWNDGLMTILYKGKGDITDMSNLRGITVNNIITKLFTNILNVHLTKCDSCIRDITGHY